MRFFLIINLFLLFQNLYANQIKQFDFWLPENSKQIAENRFQSSKSYLDTKKYYYYVSLNNKNIKLSGPELNLPHVRVLVYKISDLSSPFSHINIYFETRTNLTNIFYVLK